VVEHNIVANYIIISIFFFLFNAKKFSAEKKDPLTQSGIMPHHTLTFGVSSNAHKFHVTIPAPEATVLSVYMTIHMEDCPNCVYHSSQKTVLINCIQHYIFKFSSCVQICIFDFTKNLNFKSVKP